MKQRHVMTGLTVSASALLLAVSAHAHDPAEHMKDSKGEKPDCAAMKNMDHSKMDMNDPVMQAMMQKCMKEMHGEEQSQGEGDHSAHQHPDQNAEQEKVKPEPEHNNHQQHEE